MDGRDQPSYLSVRMRSAALMTLVLLTAPTGVGQPPGEIPHRIYGEATDESGNAVESADIDISHNGKVVASDDTDSEGYYDITVPYSSDYQGEVLDIQLESKTEATTNFKIGRTERIDLDSTPGGQSQGTEPDSSGGGGGGGGLGGTSSAPEESENETIETDEVTDTGQRNSTSQDTVQEFYNRSSTVRKQIQNITEGEEVKIRLGEAQKETTSGGGGSPQSSEDTETSPSTTDSHTGASLNSVSFETTSDTETGDITVTQTENLTQETGERISQKPDGEVIGYVEVETSVETANATFNFEISETALSQRNAKPQQVIQQRYDGSSWKDLETTHLNQTNNTHRFEAYSPNGFSVFATTMQKDSKPDKDPKSRASRQGNNLPTGVALVVLLVIATVTVLKREALVENLSSHT